LEEGAAAATTNYEIGLLRRAFTLAQKAGKVDRIPVIDSLHVSNARRGFFERAELDAVLKHLPSHLQGVMEFAYVTGWRIPSEVLRLTWDRVDFKAGWVRLDVGTTKNEDGRQFPITPELRAILERQRERGTVPYVFARHNGKPIRDFHHLWKRARRLAGLPDRIPHDLRRTAVRNLIRSGVAQVIAMKLSGHRSDTIFRRYAIVEEDMLQEAGNKLSTWAAGQNVPTSPKVNVHNSVTVTALPCASEANYPSYSRVLWTT
jgi:integrase